MRWYVMQAKPAKELFLYKQLSQREIDSYLPLVPRNNNKPRSNSMVNFYPGYLFIHTNVEELGFSNFRWIPGSRGIVSFGGEPAEVSNSFMELLIEKINSMNHKTIINSVKNKAGDPITIISGPFAGYQAVFDEYLPASDRVKLLIGIACNNYSFRAEISASQLAGLNR